MHHSRKILYFFKCKVCQLILLESPNKKWTWKLAQYDLFKVFFNSIIRSSTLIWGKCISIIIYLSGSDLPFSADISRKASSYKKSSSEYFPDMTVDIKHMISKVLPAK